MPDKRTPPDREIVEAFVGHLQRHGHRDLKIDSWPEDDHPGQSVVEALVGDLAIEHTSVDTLPDQRRVGEQFMDALGVLDHLPTTARLSINVPYELVTVGADWEAYRLALAHWILNVAPTLSDGPHDIALPNTSLTCIALKESTRPARVILSRPAQDDETLPQRVGLQITRKMKKLRRYKAEGFTTVLILETQDIALMNQHKMLEAVREGLAGAIPEGLDQLWFTEARGVFFFDFTTPIATGSDVLDDTPPDRWRAEIDAEGLPDHSTEHGYNQTMTSLLQQALERSDSVRSQVRTLIAGNYHNTEIKQRLAAAYTSLALEHHEAITGLIRSELHGSAMALVRPVFEILFQSHWVFACAKPNDVDRIAKGKKFDFPGMATLVQEVDNAYGTGGFFSEVKRRGWNAMNSYTHSGILQLSSRFDGDSVTPNYDDGALTEAVNTTTIAIAMMGRFLSVATNRTEAAATANQVLETLLSDVVPKADPAVTDRPA
jgi:hypothetical protein